MGKASGVLLLSAGLGLAAYATLPQSKTPTQSNDDFDFKLTETLPNKTELTGKAPSIATPSAAVASRSAPQEPAAPSAWGAASAPAVVTLPQHNRPSVRLPVGPQATPNAVASDRTQLARELQRELRRVGCYEGELNGGWTTSTKRAMKAFTERVNASLPIEEPDLVLLSLVKGQPDRICGQPCPAGESTEGGRCVPTAVASSQRKPAQTTAPLREAPSPAIAGWSATAGPGASGSPPPEGRTALSADGEDEQPAAGPLTTGPSGLTHQPVVSSGYTPPRNATPIDRGPSRRFDAQSFFRRLDKQSAN